MEDNSIYEGVHKYLAGRWKTLIVLRVPQHERKFFYHFNPPSVRPELCRRMNEGFSCYLQSRGLPALCTTRLSLAGCLLSNERLSSLLAVSAARNKKKLPRRNSLPQARAGRVLIYGFGPYLGFATNITAMAIRKITPRKGLKKIVFPVRFSRVQFVQAIKRHRPDIVLGLGQCAVGKRFRIERQALNRRRNARQTNPVPIDRSGPKRLSVTLRLDGDRDARPSRNAGSYVCNYSMYVMLHYLRRHHLPTRFGFIHIPHDFDRARVARYLENILGRLQEYSRQVAEKASVHPSRTSGRTVRS
jgi:pyroglutamyl-peptidase